MVNMIGHLFHWMSVGLWFYVFRLHTSWNFNFYYFIVSICTYWFQHWILLLRTAGCVALELRPLLSWKLNVSLSTVYSKCTWFISVSTLSGIFFLLIAATLHMIVFASSFLPCPNSHLADSGIHLKRFITIGINNLCHFD